MSKVIKDTYKKIKSFLKIDVSKVDLFDIIEIYDMINDFISGGEDGIIDAADAVELVRRLEKLIRDNQRKD